MAERRNQRTQEQSRDSSVGRRSETWIEPENFPPYEEVVLEEGIADETIAAADWVRRHPKAAQGDD